MFENKCIVITGGAKGIGAHLVRTFLKEGAKVAFMDWDEAAAVRLQKELEPFHTPYFFHGDVGRKEDLEAFAEGIRTRTPGVDLLIHNACISRGGILSGCSYEDFQTVLSIGVTAPYHLTMLLRRSFRKGASVVNIASTRGFMSQKDSESYAAAKGGILALTHALAVSLAGEVRVNAISPGWIDTREEGREPHSATDHGQHPAGRIGTPADIYALIAFLASPEAGFIDGENIVVDGGMSRQMIYHGDEGWRLASTREEPHR